MKKLILILGVLSMSAFAQTQEQSNESRDRPPISAEMKAAFESCKGSGKPGEASFDTCMTNKGFKKPEGHKPRGDKPMNPPPSQNNKK